MGQKGSNFVPGDIAAMGSGRCSRHAAGRGPALSPAVGTLSPGSSRTLSSVPPPTIAQASVLHFRLPCSPVLTCLPGIHLGCLSQASRLRLPYSTFPPPRPAGGFLSLLALPPPPWAPRRPTCRCPHLSTARLLEPVFQTERSCTSCTKPSGDFPSWVEKTEVPPCPDWLQLS